ncbi:MAG: diguanylate cyclase, partial [Gammaproteobacteria bacterium]
MIDPKPSYELLQFVVQRVNVGVFVVDRQYTVCYWNNFMASHSLKSAFDVVGRNLFDTFPDLPVRWFKKKIDSVFVVKSYAFTTWEYRNYLFKFKHNRPITGGDEYMCENLTLIPIKNESNGDVDQVMVLLRDSTDEACYASKLREAMAELEHLSQVDGLTGLYNRIHWEQRMAAEFARSRRYGTTFSLLMIDIDHFKKINDEFGHLAGDDVIRMVAKLIQNSSRKSDIAGRYGGEEFGILLCETGITGAVIFAERLR